MLSIKLIRFDNASDSHPEFEMWMEAGLVGFIYGFEKGKGLKAINGLFGKDCYWFLFDLQSYLFEKSKDLHSRQIDKEVMKDFYQLAGMISIMINQCVLHPYRVWSITEN